MIYQEKDGLKYIMEKKEQSGKTDQFPLCPAGSVSYTNMFSNIETYMNNEVHQHVVAGAALSGNGMLNDHGPGHIFAVEKCAFDITRDKADYLSGYEIFFLLLSIHFHDVGNILGREEHEEKIMTIFETLGDKIPLGTVEKRLIIDIAQAHGGDIDGDRDTIGHLENETYINAIKIRPSLLAAILRYSDEIADDKNRASEFLLNVGAIPPDNQIFHQYSLSLEPPVIDGATLRLEYNISEEHVKEKIKKNNSFEYLYDEILSRLQKGLCELEYCRKYSLDFIPVTCISVKVNVINSSKLKIILTKSFKIKLGGYPEKELYCPEKWLKEQNVPSNGNELKSIYEREIL